ncbi:hypothetical protein [Polaribacter sp. Asnod1-A03]|uniref:hypothetical protein n=1 Tax=Polaribacter sp. Asnod1-A03 TaxID=3160581 RepID=UPI0038688F01
MKKLVLTVAVVLLTSGVSTFALSNNSNNNSNQVVTVVVNDEFKEITIKELPESVTEAILKDFKTGAISKVYVNESEQYKIEITVDETEKVLYADKEGNWLKKEDIITVSE